MIPEIDELVIFEGSQFTGDTYVFEPTAEESHLGWLFAVAEIDERDGLGKELIDTVIQALQREYYRDPDRGILASFESALHQANLVLHDLVENGIRGWMGNFHSAVGVMANSSNQNLSSPQIDDQNKFILHLSTAGDGLVMLTRTQTINTISTGLSHSPITDPLRTFSQVASGEISTKDILYFGTANLDQVFRHQELARFVSDQSASDISVRLEQLYDDQRKNLPFAALIITLTEQVQSFPSSQSPTTTPRDHRNRIPLNSTLQPRKPLIINNSVIKKSILLIIRLISFGWYKLRVAVWPKLKQSSRKSGQVIFKASKSAKKGIFSLSGKNSTNSSNKLSELSVTQFNKQNHWLRFITMIPTRILHAIKEGLAALPRSSKIFGVIAIILAVSLGVSLVLLQNKRAADSQIQRASEYLHEARTKKEAAETALIVDNREQARKLLTEAHDLTSRIQTTALYQEQTTQLLSEINAAKDRLDRITRVSPSSSKTIGDFTAAAPNIKPTKIFLSNNSLYSFDPTNNNIVRMDLDGNTNKVSQTTQGIGFFTDGITHNADKSIIILTNSPGIALYDTKNKLLQKQEIEFPSSEPQILSVATYGNRLYLYDKTSSNIFGYSKSLRGYSGGNTWLTAKDFPSDTIIDIGVDGYVYTLHKDGSINKLLKGEPVDFNLEPVEPTISASAQLIINEDLRHLYIFDPPNQRVVIYDTVGNLSHQIYFNTNSNITDVAVNPEETVLYALDKSEVQAINIKY